MQHISNNIKGESKVLIKDCSKDDIITLNGIVEIHIKTFKGFFLTFLGKGFLKHLYKGFCAHKNSGLIAAELNGRTVGFLAYSENLSGFYKYLICHSLIPFAWYGLCAFLKRPSSFMRLVRAFLKPGESKRDENYLELSSIGVLPDMKNMDIGSSLINALKERFDHDRFSYIKLETDANDNEKVNRFYVKNGFECICTYETPEGRKMNEYRWSDINENSLLRVD